jgi:hypothetical protein
MMTPSFRISCFCKRSFLLGFFGSVFGAALFSVLNAYGIQGATDDMIPYSRKVFYPSSSNKNNGVFLKIMADAWNISGDFDAIG